MTSPTFWNIIARRYAKSAVSNPAAYEKKLEMTAAHLTPDMRLLEVGCGTGTTALIHAPRVAALLGVDFSPKMIAIAREKAAAQGVENATFEVGRIEELPAPPTGGPFDAALALSVLHLLPDATAALRTLARQLRPGGLLFTSTTCIGDDPSLLHRLLPLIGRTGLIPPVAAITEQDVLAAHAAAGFEIVERFRPGPKNAVFFVARSVGQDQTPL